MLDYRPVTIDVNRVSQLMAQKLGRIVTQIEAEVVLRQVGFIPYNGAWLGDSQSMAHAGRENWNILDPASPPEPLSSPPAPDHSRPFGPTPVAPVQHPVTSPLARS